MNLSGVFYYFVILSTIAGPVPLPGRAGSEAKKRTDTIVVNGRSGPADVVVIDNREYIDVRSLAGIAQGSVEFQGSRIIFTIPVPESSGNTSPKEEPEQKSNSDLSQQFVKAGIEEIALMREWASPLAYAIQNGYPITQQAESQYKAQAASGLRLAQAAAKTDADRSAFQLLSNEFAALEHWSSKLIEARKSMDTAKYAMSDTALRDDPLSQKIIACGHFLGSMLGSGTFQDDASCH
jgi:hypothetical protein